MKLPQQFRIRDAVDGTLVAHSQQMAQVHRLECLPIPLVDSPSLTSVEPCWHHMDVVQNLLLYVCDDRQRSTFLLILWRQLPMR
jgi:hypothetical protein